MPLRLVIPILWVSIAAVGCTVSRTASAAGKVVVGTVSVAGKTAATAASTGGKVAVTAASTTGTMSQSSVSAVGSLAQGKVVTFVDQTTGMVKQLPWVDGLHLYSASKTAKMDLARHAIHVVRGSQIIETSWDQLKSGASHLDLKPGDLIEVTRLTAK